MAIGPKGTGIVKGYQMGPYANLEGANLELAIFTRANLKGANLKGANLYKAMSPRSNLEDADLTGANLKGAYLVDANFTGANFTGANLEGADLTGAILTGAILVGANFASATVDPHHFPLIEAAFREMMETIVVSGGTEQGNRFSAQAAAIPAKVNPFQVAEFEDFLDTGRASAPGRKVISPSRKVISPGPKVISLGPRAISPELEASYYEDDDYAMGDEETVVGIVPVHIYSDEKRVYFFSDAEDANEFLKMLPLSIKSRAKIGNHFSSTTVTLYPPDRKVISPKTSEGTIIGSDGKQYYIGPGADLRGSNLEGADLYGMDLTGADLSGANLMGADLAGTILRGAYLTNADLEGARLFVADLREAHLMRANLKFARLTAAKLDGADLREADLEGATMPDGTIYSGRATNPGYGHHHGYGRRR